MSIPSRLPSFQRLRMIGQIVLTGAAIQGFSSANVTGSDTPIEANQSVTELVAPGPAVPPTIAAAPPESNGVGASEAEQRIAKRPWLLEKLVGPEKIESQKLDPPHPPVDFPDPPSMSRIVPRTAASAAPSHQQQSVAPKPLRDPAPLRDPDSSNSESRQPSLGADSQHVIAGNVEPPIVPTVTVRKLRIARDGSLIPDESQEAEIPAEEISDSQSNGNDEDQETGNFVGDIEPTEIHPESVATEAIPEPTVEDEIVDRADQGPLDYTGYPQQPIRLTRDVVRMRGMMQRCLQYYYNRPEVANARSNWGMMHSIMVYGIDTRVVVGRRRYSAIAWVAGNNVCRGQKLLTVIDGQIAAKSGVGLQGHQGQLLAVLSLAGVPAEYALHVEDQKFSIDDLVDAEMLACQQGEELTFTLIGLSHYLDTESQWRNAEGEKWDFEELIRSELSQPIVGAACGGSHRLMGFAHALRARRAEGRPITGQWKRAEEYVQQFQQYTYRLQNRDGSMSTDWFEGREDNGDLERKIQTTGHMVEWLLTVTPDTELQNPRLVRAIQFLLKSMYHERDTDWEIGPKGHALRSLAMFYERVYQAGPAWRTQSVARGRQPRRR